MNLLIETFQFQAFQYSWYLLRLEEQRGNFAAVCKSKHVIGPSSLQSFKTASTTPLQKSRMILELPEPGTETRMQREPEFFLSCSLRCCRCLEGCPTENSRHWIYWMKAAEWMSWDNRVLYQSAFIPALKEPGKTLIQMYPTIPSAKFATWANLRLL